MGLLSKGVARVTGAFKKPEQQRRDEGWSQEMWTLETAPEASKKRHFFLHRRRRSADDDDASVASVDRPRFGGGLSRLRPFTRRRREAKASTWREVTPLDEACVPRIVDPVDDDDDDEAGFETSRSVTPSERGSLLFGPPPGFAAATAANDIAWLEEKPKLPNSKDPVRPINDENKLISPTRGKTARKREDEAAAPPLPVLSPPKRGKRETPALPTPATPDSKVVAAAAASPRPVVMISGRKFDPHTPPRTPLISHQSRASPYQSRRERRSLSMSPNLAPPRVRALLSAAEAGDVLAVKRHLSNIDVDVADPQDGYTALTIASEEGRLDVVAHLVERAGADVEKRDAVGRTPLYAAAVADQAKVVAYLVRAGADPTVVDDDHRSIFWACCAVRARDAAVALLDSAAARALVIDIDARDPCGLTAVEFAANRGHATILQLLRQRGAVEEFRKSGRDRLALNI
ncbi:hypothetical protein CTAYLR_000118 [Chrysophaeum taylorii]|uniref:Uncharacterized protein n=1 Tax=Chrysophaeum taylorii TaxID=2483200 RepID=A0AAD7XNG7_9STRA|nr:hypothetical protein CTAYLR_000118 [Chrysophaeum taylorii]